MWNASFLALRVAMIWLLVLPIARAGVATIEIFPSTADATCNEEFQNVANELKPGDVLILHGGTYTQTCRRAITVNSTAVNPITIRAADGEHPITFEGNEVHETGNNAIRLNSGNTDAFTIRGNHIHHTGLLASSAGL